ncbi:MAG: hypothetical protein K1W00_08415 [Lachnospiraceae bacterium]
MSKLVELAEKEILRQSILEIAEQSGTDGASVILIKKALSKTGLKPSDEQLKRGISYLEDKGLVSVKHIANRALGIERDMVSLTSKGMDVLDGAVEEAGIGAGD